MIPQTFVFFGRSGCGKGTQVKLLIEHLKKVDLKRETLYIETGGLLRDFVAKNKGMTKDRVATVLDKGGLLPEFIPICMWSNLMINKITGDEHIVCDGVSRRPSEAPVLDSAFRFYDRENPNIILIDVSPKWAMERLLARGRSDDKEEEIKKRSQWFDDNVRVAVKFFEDNPYYKFHTVDGEQTIEEVHAEVLKSVGL